MKFTSSNFKGLQKHAYYDPETQVDLQNSELIDDKQVIETAKKLATPPPNVISNLTSNPWWAVPNLLSLRYPHLAKAIVPTSVYGQVSSENYSNMPFEAYYGLGWMFPSIDKKVQKFYDWGDNKLTGGRTFAPPIQRETRRNIISAKKNIRNNATYKGKPYNRGGLDLYKSDYPWWNPIGKHLKVIDYTNPNIPNATSTRISANQLKKLENNAAIEVYGHGKRKYNARNKGKGSTSRGWISRLLTFGLVHGLGAYLDNKEQARRQQKANEYRQNFYNNLNTVSESDEHFRNTHENAIGSRHGKHK